MAAILPSAKNQFLDANGRPLAGGKLYFYFPGTENKKDTFQDSNLTVPNTNPVVLDAYGEAIIWGTGTYRQVLTDKNDVQLWDQVTKEPGAATTTDSKVDAFVAGVDFTPGMTSALTLSLSYGSVNNIEVFFDGNYQQQDQIQSLIDKTLTFTSPIPVGISRIEVRGGSTTAIAVPSAGSVTDDKIAPGSKLYFVVHSYADPKSFGAKGDGVTNDTAAVLAAMADKPHVEFGTDGVYVIDQITIPTTLKTLVSRTGARLLPSSNVPAGPAAYWIQGTNLSQAQIAGFAPVVDPDKFPNLTAIALLACADSYIEDIDMEKSGIVGIYGGNCSSITVRNNKIMTFKKSGIVFEGASSYANVVEDNWINGAASAGYSTAHGVTFQAGQFNKASRNHVVDTGTFGIEAFQTANAIITDNTIYNTTHEGINAEDSNEINVSNNDISWPTTASRSIDFGISIFGNAADTQFCSVRGNRVTRSGSAGICLTGRVSFSMTSENTVLNCNVNGVADPGILLAGSSCNLNRVDQNMVVDTAANKHVYGISETDKGNGLPSLNAAIGNFVRGYVSAPYGFTASTNANSANNVSYA